MKTAQGLVDSQEDTKEIKLRDQFAGQAMQSFLTTTDGPIEYALVAQYAYQMADAMLRKRKNDSM